jgi:HEPN domain-containing protein
LSNPEGAELAALLDRKAKEDATAVREFAANSEISDGIIGFHAQQAVEKWLKAAMAHRGVVQPRIHDLGRLVQVLESERIELPENAGRLDELTIYAVPLRYDDLLDVEPLDREDTVQLVGQVEAWAGSQIDSDRKL